LSLERQSGTRTKRRCDEAARTNEVVHDTPHCATWRCTKSVFAQQRAQSFTCSISAYGVGGRQHAITESS
jgi:hypothetical protein